MKPVYTVSYHPPHLAAHSGYDAMTRWVGEPVTLSRPVYWAGETILRIPAKLTSWYGGVFEYSRHDFVMEWQVLLHMLRRRNCIYHFVHGEKSFKLLARAAGLRGHRFVATFHHPESHFPWLFRSTRHLRRLHHAIVLSSVQLDVMRRLLGDEQVSFIPHGIDTDYFTPASVRPANPAPRCLFAGYHMRDLDTLADVVRRVLAGHPSATFTLVTKSEQCRAIAADPRVRWIPRLTEEEYLRTVQGADLVVLPLKESTAVSSALEALGCGVPVITNHGGVADYVTPECGALLPVGDAEGMAGAILDILADRARLERMRVTARDRALSLAWPRIAERIRQLYAGLPDIA